jgi:hypothetical protein
MLFRDGGRALDVAAVAYLGRARIPLEQERLWSCAGRTQAAEKDEEESPTSWHISQATASQKNGKD